jgi:hypothetical protein
LGGITIEGCNITIDVRIMYQDTEWFIRFGIVTSAGFLWTV